MQVGEGAAAQQRDRERLRSSVQDQAAMDELCGFDSMSKHTHNGNGVMFPPIKKGTFSFPVCAKPPLSAEPIFKNQVFPPDGMVDTSKAKLLLQVLQLGGDVSPHFVPQLGRRSTVGLRATIGRPSVAQEFGCAGRAFCREDHTGRGCPHNAVYKSGTVFFCAHPHPEGGGTT
jgi:hypothetical protein